MAESFPISFGHYELLERLAIGGMAELFLARSTSPGGPDKPVVIKRLLPHLAADPHFNAMFIDEAKLTKRLSHPNIVATLEFNRHEDQLFMVMEYVEGLDGLALLRECARRRVRLPTEIAVHLIHEVLDALDFAHRQVDDQGRPMGVVHRDISPSNLLLSRHGEVKLVDFGIARATQRHHNTKDGTLKGKYGYMSPEQVMETPIDARSDLFSVGIVLAEMLTGRRLFAAPNELDVLLMVRDVKLDRLDRYGRHIGLDLDRILRKALRKNPDDRFESAAEFRDVLAEWLHLHNHEITPALVAQVVESLYGDVWQRKRDVVAHADAERAALVADVPKTAGKPAGKAAGKVEFAAIEPSDVMLSAEQIDGIPAGAQWGTDSVPMVSVTIDEEGDDEVEIGVLEVAPVAGDTAAEDSAQGAPAAIPLNLSDVEPAEDTEGPMDTMDLTDAVELMEESREIAAAAVPPPIPKEASEKFSIKTARPAPPPASEDDSDRWQTNRLRDTALDFDDSEVSAVGESRKLAAIRSPQPALPDPRAYGITTAGDAADPAAVVQTRFDSDIGEQPDDSGDFAESPPIAVFYRLAVARATGLLATVSGDICKEIYFREGIPEYVASNVAKELFGEYLTDQGILSRGELSMALAMMPKYGGRLGDTLIGLGLLKPLEVFRYLTRQVRDKLIDVCTWSRGVFRWYGGRENPRAAFPLDLNALEVIGAGALALPEDNVNRWLETLRLRSRPWLVPDGRIHPAMFQIGPVMAEVCSQLNGELYLAELKAHFRDIGEYDSFVRILYLLAHTELVIM